MTKKVNEGQHYHTKVRSLDEQAGLRRIRMGLRESCRLIGNILNPNHPTPNPETEQDAKALNEAIKHISKIAEGLKKVRTKKRVK